MALRAVAVTTDSTSTSLTSSALPICHIPSYLELYHHQAWELALARKIINHIQKCDLYRRIDLKIIDWDLKGVCQANITPESIVHADLPGVDHGIAAVDHVIVDVSTMHYGRGGVNPVFQVMFYSKYNPNMCQQAEKEDISLVVPEKFGEVLMQVYTKEEKFMGLVQAAYLHVFRSLPIPDDQSEIATIEVMTP
ncbi:hypothetical protein AZE42_03001 [Rhizopogon vesiculosus]|uniref:Uncharacterized protein n=1 Tax=Rhizopogon vesiculosus TaxID=180088 RepID=A0A1J8PFH9_9AGAM|nr:hypothetical protein AZE42_03001 [Rhizopogon vesiculosus]